MGLVRVPDNALASGATHIYVPTATVADLCVLGPYPGGGYGVTLSTTGSYGASHTVFTGTQAACEAKADEIARAIGIDWAA